MKLKYKYSLGIGLAAFSAFSPMATQAAMIDVVTTQTVNNTAFGVNVNAITVDTTWTSDNSYILTDKVFVTNGATLTIQPGTKIYSTLDDQGDADINNDEFGSLVITRDANIIAQGTAEAPIVFTTIDELEALDQADYDGDSLIAETPTNTTSGRWGGLVILGNAPIASYTGATNIGENRIEGFQPAASADLDADGRADVIEYGGANAADNSGILTYISIRHGGYVYSGANEINGLTLGGVGNGTVINHLEVFANKDDGIEFFGGTVNTSNILLAFNFDDSFDIDEGYKGINQFWFAVQNPFESNGTTKSYDNGGEWDGVTGTIANNATNSSPTIYNATFIGTGTGADPAGNDKGNNAIFIDDRFQGLIYNSVFDDFADDVVGSSSDGPGTGLTFSHNTVGRFGNATPGQNLTYVTDGGAANTFYDGSGNPLNGNSAGGVDPLYNAYSRDTGLFLEVLDPRPATGSPLWVANGATLQGGAPETVTYRGAFGTENWAAGWSRYDQMGYFKTKVDVIAEQTVNNTQFGVNVNAITSDTTWNSDSIYFLTDKVFVTNGATLTIEAGTKIYSSLDDQGNAEINDDQFGSLVITRGANIIAEGTAEAPIVFTTIDELEAESGVDYDLDGVIAEMPTNTTSGRWGGLVILGNAPISSYSGATNVGENRIEGFQPAASADLDADGRADVIEYGGGNAADNSGILKYVSIRHGGYVYAAGSEINGLTLGGVGNGTEISFIEVFANRDDGIEFFGGSVNTSNILLAFNFDDSFDIDEGYNGINQFWFAVQNPLEADGTTRAYDNGGEWDGVTGTIGDYTNNSAPTIFNATFIGTGTGANPAGNDKGNNAIFIDDRFKGMVYNSVFDDFADDIVGSSSDGPGTGLTFSHNTVGRFGNATPGQNLTYVTDAGAANTFFDGAGEPLNGNSDGGINPLYTAYARNSSLFLVVLDPRPATESPLWTANGATLQSGAPETVTYRGAFGTENWASGWSRYDQLGYFSNEVPDDTTPPVIVLVGGSTLTVSLGDSFTDPGAIVSDNVDATTNITGTGTVNTSEIGNYILTYNFTDEAGNVATTVTRTVNVELFETTVDFTSSAGAPLDISDFFQVSPFEDADVVVVGKLPKGMAFNATTKAITGYPTVAGTATFSVTLPGEAPFEYEMNFILESVPLAFQGTHVLHTDEGDVITAVISTKGTKVTVLKPGQKVVTLKGAVMTYNAEEDDVDQQWTINVPASNLAISFPTTRTLKAGDNSYLGNYGTFEGDALWGFKATTGLGTIVLSKGSLEVSIVGVIGTKGVSWTVTPTGGKAIKSTGSISADGIASINTTIPGATPQLLSGMLRVQEELDINDVPTGVLNVSLLQGFEGWDSESYTAP